MTPHRGALASLLRPFDAYLPRPELAEKVVAPAYDTLTIEETHQIAADNPLSFLNVVRSEIDYPEQTEEERRALLTDTAARLRRLLGSDIFDHYDRPTFFVCRLELDGHAQVGIIVDVALDAYDQGLVKVHESTRRGQEDRLVTYMNLVRASFLPVFLIHRPSAPIDEVVAAITSRDPVIDMQADRHVQISVWVAHTTDDIAAIEQALSGLDALYVADGHHRAAAASRFAASHRGENGSDGAPSQHLASVLFPADQLVVHGYNRFLTDLGDHTADGLLAAIAAVWPVAESAPGEDPAPRRSGELSMYVAGRWHRITIPDAARRPRGVAGLDVTALHQTILEPLLGLGDPRTDPRVEFVPGTLGLTTLERMCEVDFAAAFVLHPMEVDDLLEVADRGELMPPKSTWFSPKLRSGLVVRLL